MNKLIPLALLVAALFLGACDPFKAEQIRAESEASAQAVEVAQYAANQEQARQFAADRHNFDMIKAEQARQVYDAALPTIKTVARVAAWTGGLAFAIALAGLILSGAYTVQATAAGLGAAMVRAATVRANLIYVDPKTGQLPVFLYEGHGKYSMVMPGVAGVIPLDTRHEPDRQMIATQGAALETWLLAREASRSDDPAGVSIISPKAIDVTPEMTAYHKALKDIGYE